MFSTLIRGTSSKSFGNNSRQIAALACKSSPLPAYFKDEASIAFRKNVRCNYSNCYGPLMTSNYAEETNFTGASKRLRELERNEVIGEANIDETDEYNKESLMKALQINDFDSALEIGQDQWDLGNYFEAMSVYDQTLSRVMSTSSTKQDYNDATLHHFAELLTRIGMCHTSVGNHIEALNFYEKSLDVLRGKFPCQSHEKIGKVLNAMGMSHAQLGESRNAEECFKASIEELKICGYPNESLANIFENLSKLLVEEGNYHRALDNIEEAIRLQESVQTNDNATRTVEIAGLHLQAGKIHHSLHELGKASSSYRQAVNMLKEEDHPVVAQSLFNLALVYTKVNKLDDALQAHKQALHLKKLLFGSSHEEVADSLNHIGVVWASKGNKGEALKIFKESLRTYRSAGFSESNKSYQNVAKNIALIETS